MTETLDDLIQRMRDAGLDLGSHHDDYVAVRLAFAYSPQAARALAEGMIAKLAPGDAQLTAAGAVTPRAVEAIVEREGVGFDDAVQLAEADRRIAQVRAQFAPQAADVPWLDTRELTGEALPRPWSDDDFQRDRRRAVATGVLGELDRATWERFAEQGQDAVAELLREACDGQVAELQRLQANVLQTAKDRARDRQQAEQRAAEGRPATGGGRLVLDGKGLAL